ncbi:MAG: 16S rRNA (uracil(1498)-N(3))-methyltransferase [Methylohalobius sp. ZOD2]
MRVSRLYLPEPLETGLELAVTGERAHYLANVLRLRAGASLTVFNGRGGEYGAELFAANRRQVRLKIDAKRAREAESPLQTHLGLAVAKGERMDWAVQKAVELGVTEIFPLLTEHGNVQLKGGKPERKRQHWQKIAIAACEQCGRNRIPEIGPPEDFDAWLDFRHGGVLLDPGGIPFPDLAPPKEKLILLIGPEGGLSPEERRRAQDRGFVPARLGPRILRVETAVAAALSAAQVLWGDGGG